MFGDIFPSSFFINCLILLSAFLLEDLIKIYRYSFLDKLHPIVLFGVLSDTCESIFNHGSAVERRIKGILSFCLLIFGVWFIGYLLRYFYPLSDFIVLLFMLCARQLFDFAEKVAGSKTLKEKRQNAARMVGRDLSNADVYAVNRAAIESLAENFCDAVVAPVLYYALFGVEGILIYKAIDTLDSQWGYKSKRFLNFGYFAAKADDVVNFIPARLSVLLLLLSGLIAGSKKSLIDGYCYVKIHAYGRASPNAPLSQAVLSYFLDLRLMGPRKYKDKEKQPNNSWLGNGRIKATLFDIQLSVKIVKLARFLLLIFCFCWAGILLFIEYFNIF